MTYSALNEKKSLLHTFESKPYLGTIILDPETQRKKLELNAPVYFQHEINKFKVGEVVTLRVTNRKPKSTQAQHNYLFGAYYPLIKEETGQDDIEAMHERFKGEFLSDGIVEIFGKKVIKKRSSKSLSVVEFMQFIQNIEVLTGVQAPPVQNFV